MLYSITPAVARLRDMFTRVQYALKRVTGRHVQLTADVHDELEAWRELVCSLASYNLFSLHGLVLPMHWGPEWEHIRKL